MCSRFSSQLPKLQPWSMQIPASNKAEMQEQSPSQQEERIINKERKKATLLSDEARTCNCESWKER